MFATMTASAVIAFGIDALRLYRIHASRFARNIASYRVPEKMRMRRLQMVLSEQTDAHWQSWAPAWTVPVGSLPANETGTDLAGC